MVGVDTREDAGVTADVTVLRPPGDDPGQVELAMVPTGQRTARITL